METNEEQVKKKEIYELDDIPCPSDNNGGTSKEVGPREYNIINVESVQSTEKFEVFTFYVVTLSFIIYQSYKFHEHEIINV